MPIGKIKSISCHPLSGLATIFFEDGNQCAIESGFGLRQLTSVFDDENPIGKVIDYDINEYGIMSGFDL